THHHSLDPQPLTSTLFPYTTLFRSSAQHHGELIHHLRTGGEELVLGRYRHGVTQGPPTRQDGDLVHRVRVGKCVPHQGMATLVVGDDLLLLFGHHPGLALGTGHDAFDGLLQHFVGDGRVARPGRQQGPLVDDVGQVRTGHPGGLSGYDVEVDVVGHGFALGVDLEDVAAPVHVGAVHDDLPVETARTQQCRVEDVGAVGG